MYDIKVGRCADPSAADWRNAIEKRENDNVLKQYWSPFFSESRPFFGVTFPAGDAVMERNLAEDFPKQEFDFLGVERDPKVYHTVLNTIRQQRKTLPNLSLTFPFGSVPWREFLRRYPTPESEEDRYNLVYPDGMGTWSLDKYYDLEILFKKHLMAVNGFLVITAMLSRGSRRMSNLLSQYAGDVRQRLIPLVTDGRREYAPWTYNCELKVFGVPAMIETLAAIHGVNLATTRVHLYSSMVFPESPTHSQISFMFQRLQ